MIEAHMFLLLTDKRYFGRMTVSQGVLVVELANEESKSQKLWGFCNWCCTCVEKGRILWDDGHFHYFDKSFWFCWQLHFLTNEKCLYQGDLFSLPREWEDRNKEGKADWQQDGKYLLCPLWKQYNNRGVCRRAQKNWSGWPQLCVQDTPFIFTQYHSKIKGGSGWDFDKWFDHAQLFWPLWGHSWQVIRALKTWEAD